MNVTEIAECGYLLKPCKFPDMASELLWYQMAFLRHKYDSGEISKTEATATKLDYYSQYERNSARLYFDRRIRENHAKMYKELEPFALSMRNGTIKEAGKVIDIIDGCFDESSEDNNAD